MTNQTHSYIISIVETLKEGILLFHSIIPQNCPAVLCKIRERERERERERDRGGGERNGINEKGCLVPTLFALPG